MLALTSALLDAPPASLARHVDGFLRLRGRGAPKPLPRMPTWLWLCRRASADAKAPPLRGSERLRALVERAALEVCSRWLARLGEMGGRGRTLLLAGERRGGLAQAVLQQRGGWQAIRRRLARVSGRATSAALLLLRHRHSRSRRPAG